MNDEKPIALVNAGGNGRHNLGNNLDEGFDMNKSISEGDVYEKNNKIRRVICVVKDVVAYSNGGDRNGYCRYKTFMRWIGGKNSSTKKIYGAQP